MKTVMKKSLSILLSAILLATCVPVEVFAQVGTKPASELDNAMFTWRTGGTVTVNGELEDALAKFGLTTQDRAGAYVDFFVVAETQPGIPLKYVDYTKALHQDMIGKVTKQGELAVIHLSGEADMVKEFPAYDRVYKVGDRTVYARVVDAYNIPDAYRGAGKYTDGEIKNIHLWVNRGDGKVEMRTRSNLFEDYLVLVKGNTDAKIDTEIAKLLQGDTKVRFAYRMITDRSRDLDVALPHFIPAGAGTGSARTVEQLFDMHINYIDAVFAKHHVEKPLNILSEPKAMLSLPKTKVKLASKYSGNKMFDLAERLTDDVDIPLQYMYGSGGYDSYDVTRLKEILNDYEKILKEYSKEGAVLADLTSGEAPLDVLARKYLETSEQRVKKYLNIEKELQSIEAIRKKLNGKNKLNDFFDTLRTVHGNCHDLYNRIVATGVSIADSSEPVLMFISKTGKAKFLKGIVEALPRIAEEEGADNLLIQLLKANVNANSALGNSDEEVIKLIKNMRNQYAALERELARQAEEATKAVKLARAAQGIKVGTVSELLKKLESLTTPEARVAYIDDLKLPSEQRKLVNELAELGYGKEFLNTGVSVGDRALGKTLGKAVIEVTGKAIMAVGFLAGAYLVFSNIRSTKAISDRKSSIDMVAVGSDLRERMKRGEASIQEVNAYFNTSAAESDIQEDPTEYVKYMIAMTIVASNPKTKEMYHDDMLIVENWDPEKGDSSLLKKGLKRSNMTKNNPVNNDGIPS